MNFWCGLFMLTRVIAGSWSRPSSFVWEESFHLGLFSLKCKSCWHQKQVMLIVPPVYVQNQWRCARREFKLGDANWVGISETSCGIAAKFPTVKSSPAHILVMPVCLFPIEQILGSRISFILSSHSRWMQRHLNTGGVCGRWQQVTSCWLLCFRYFIFTSFWAYKIYYVYGFMMLVLVILCIVTVCVTIVCTYFLLNAEDYRWWVSLRSLVDSAPLNSRFKVWLTLILSFPGNGQVSSLLHPRLFMFTCTRFTTTSSKPSKSQVSFNLQHIQVLFTPQAWKHFQIVLAKPSFFFLSFLPSFQDVRAVPDILLLWLHGCVQHCFRNYVWWVFSQVPEWKKLKKNLAFATIRAVIVYRISRITVLSVILLNNLGHGFKSGSAA